jgi:serine phosphatase RsbU (regulator of sigma subunit)
MAVSGDGDRVLGDAPGSGAHAAVAAGDLRYRLHRLLADGMRPVEAVAELDAYAAAVGSETLAASLVVAVIDSANDRIGLVNAGHPPPLVATGGFCTARYLDADPDPLLGLRSERHQSCYKPTAGSTLYLYSDGLIERHGAPLLYESLDLLLEAAHSLPSAAAGAAALAGRIVDQLGQPPDDATLLSIGRAGTPYQLAALPEAVGRFRPPDISRGLSTEKHGTEAT